MGKFERKTRVCYFEGRNLVLYVPDTDRGQELLFQTYRAVWLQIITTLANLKGDDIVDQLGRKLKYIPRIGEFIAQLQPLCVYDLSRQQMLVSHNIVEFSLQNGETWFYTEEGQVIGVYRQGYQWARRSWQWLKKMDWKDIGACIGIFICYFMFIYGIGWLDERWQKAKADDPEQVIPQLKVENRLDTDGYLIMPSDSIFTKLTYQIGKNGYEQPITLSDTLFPSVSGLVRVKGFALESHSVAEFTFDQAAFIENVVKNRVGSRPFNELFLRKPILIVYDDLFEDKVDDVQSYGKIQLMISRLDRYKVERVVMYPRFDDSAYQAIKEIYLKSKS